MAEKNRDPTRFSKYGSNQRGVSAAPRHAPVWIAGQHERSRRDRDEILRFVKEQEEKKSIFGNRNLPAYKHKREITNAVERYKAILLGGPTGSGKSTQVPQFLYEAGFEKTYVLVPRRIIANGLFDRLIEEMSEHMGLDEAKKVIGIAHGERGENVQGANIVVMTPNTFTRMEAEIREEYCDKRVAIISDEIHEANVYTELATGIAAQAVDELDTWRLVAASATHNSPVLEKVFKKINGGEAPTISIEGRPFDVSMQECEYQTPMEAYVETGHAHGKSMIFTSGKKEIDHIISETKKAMETRQKGASEKIVFRKLHGELTPYQLFSINDPVPDGHRLVVVSTPAGMSGITIPGVTGVYMDGTINREKLDRNQARGLEREYTTQAEITQMMGRAGRDTTGGLAYLCKTVSIEEDLLRSRGKEVEDEKMPFRSLSERDAFPEAEIYSSNISQSVLAVSALDREYEIINNYLPNQVKEINIHLAKELLARLGALDHSYEITQVGRDMSLFPVRPEMSRSLIETWGRGINTQKRSQEQLARMAIIVSAIEAGGMQEYGRDVGTQWKDFIRRSTRDDPIAQLDIATEYLYTPQDEPGRIDFLAQHDLSYKRSEQTRKTTRKVLSVLGMKLRDLDLPISSHKEEDEIRRDLTVGMIENIYTPSSVKDRSKQQKYRHIHDASEETLRNLDSRSVVRHKEPDELVAGFGRYFYKGDTKHDVIGPVILVKPTVVAEVAEKMGLLTARSLKTSIHDGVVKVLQQPMFGTLEVGKTEYREPEMHFDKESRDTLASYVVSQGSSKQGQRMLREVAEAMGDLRNRTPASDFKKVVKSEQFITNEDINEMIFELAGTTRSAHEIDNKLRMYAYEHNVTLERYIDRELLDLLYEMSPTEIVIEDVHVEVLYEEGVPYTTLRGVNDEQKQILARSGITLPDGREVLCQVDGGQGKVRISAQSMRVGE